MDLFGTHKVTWEMVMASAIQCHALDISAYHLFKDSTHSDTGNKTQAVYEELSTGQLLNLAIAIRTKFYQGIKPEETIPLVRPCGLLYKKSRNGTEETVDFSMKDVCDKIIHAACINRHLEDGVLKPTTTLRGRDNRDNSEWELSLSVSLFTEAVLNWALDESTRKLD